MSPKGSALVGSWAWVGGKLTTPIPSSFKHTHAHAHTHVALGTWGFVFVTMRVSFHTSQRASAAYQQAVGQSWELNASLAAATAGTPVGGEMSWGGTSAEGRSVWPPKGHPWDGTVRVLVLGQESQGPAGIDAPENRMLTESHGQRGSCGDGW